MQISYLSHLDICQLSNPQPRFGEELLGCDTACGLEFKESTAKEVWKQGKKAADAQLRQGVRKICKRKGKHKALTRNAVCMRGGDDPGSECLFVVMFHV